MSARRDRLSWEILRLLQDVTVASDRYVDAASRSEGLHRSDLQALAAVVRHGDVQAPLTVSELAKRLNLSSPATTALVDRLEGNGHLERHRDTVDRRRVTLSGTETARSTGRRLFLPMATAVQNVSAKFDEAELDVVRRYLDAATEAIASVGPAPRDPAARPEAGTA